MSRTSAIIVAAALLSVGLAACGDNDPGTTDVTDDTEADTLPNRDDRPVQFRAELTALNGSGVTGFVTVDADSQVRDTSGSVTVTVEARGVSNDVPHPQHLHIGGEGECPDQIIAGTDDVLTVEEGMAAYGPIAVSLTLDGPTGADAYAFDLGRYPTGVQDAIGYVRNFDLQPPVNDGDLDGAVYVVHGMPSLSGDPEQYDGDAPSSVDPELPLEATIPIACGALGGPGA